MSTADVIQVIQDEILGDDTNDSARLLATYEKADKKGKELIDDVLVSICGWSMPSLQQLAHQRSYTVNDE